MLAVVERLPVEVLPVNRQSVLEAAHIKTHYPIAYAVAFTIAAAQAHGGIVATGDPEFNAVPDIVLIEWLNGG